jgi:hypothetical protein
MLGPLVFGIPHLLAGYSVLPYAVGYEPKKPQRTLHLKRLFLLATLAMGFAWYNRALAPGWSAALVFLVFFLFAAQAAPAGRKHLIARGVLLAPMLLGLVCAPYATCSILLFAHNGVAFWYWYRFSSCPAERRVCVGAFMLTVGISCAIAWGAGDHLNLLAELPSFLLPFSSFELPVSFQEWGWRPNLLHLQRMMVIAAFAQALHYLLWLKIIPEVVSGCPVPLSLTRTCRKIRNEVRYPLLGTAAVLWIALCGVGLWFPAQASALYVSLAAAHGFAELGVLAALPIFKTAT